MEKQNTKSIVLYAVFLAAVILLVVRYSFGSVTLRTIDESKIFALLGSLMVLALFLERALEVFVATSRSPGAIDLDTRIECMEKEIATLGEAGEKEKIGNAKTKLADLEKQRVIYKSETRKVSLWLALAFGILVSAVGIRTLGSLVTEQDLRSLAGLQKSLFDLVDVFVTGGLLAGGSDGIHQLAKIYTNYTEALAKKPKSQ